MTALALTYFLLKIVTIVIPAAIGALIYALFWKGEAEVQGHVTSEDNEDSQATAVV